MINKLTYELRAIGITLSANTLNPEFSDYVIKFDEKIVGYGWKRENVKEKVGFMGLAAPAWENCIWRVSSLPKNLNFEEIINLFQFAVSEDFIWFSLPTNNIMIGYTSDPFHNSKEFISDLKIFIENGFDPKIFLK
jgi:hypothetical protein